MSHKTVQQLFLKDIEVFKNYRDTEPPSITDPDIIELAEHIKQSDVFQSILVRPHPSKKDKYQVIFGHRRLMASQLAKKETIPASVRNIADEEVLELQVAENLQRKDVHPWDEAFAYRALIDQRHYTIDDLSLKFAKASAYITQRLKLIDLAPELAKAFRKNQMSLGQALEICRLTPAHQLSMSKYYHGNFLGHSLHDIRKYITANITRQLSSAPFDINDEKLYPSAGACSICQKRTGTGNLLFEDVESKDRCFDAACFKKKSDIFFRQEVLAIIESRPEVHLLQVRHGQAPVSMELNTLLQKHKIKPLVEYDDFYSHSYSSSFQKKVKGFWINGTSEGKIVTVYLKGAAKSSAKDAGAAGSADKSPAELIKSIRERTRRGAELDDEKVHERIVSALKQHPCQKVVPAKLKSMPAPESVALAYMVLMDVPFERRSAISSKLGLKGLYSGSDHPEVLYKQLLELSQGDLTWIVRVIMISRYSGTSKRSNNGYITRRIAEGLKDIPIETFEAEQMVMRERREKRAAERISALSALQAPVKKMPSAASRKKASKKKVA